jgi:hypothetical protein
MAKAGKNMVKPAAKPRAKKRETVLVLRTCDKDLKAHGNFQWKDKGVVTCPDWDKAPVCGQGLHGLLWGEGNGELLNWDVDSKWLVVAVDASSIVNLNDKVKFPEGEVVYCGDRLGATSLIAAKKPSANVVGLCRTVGDKGSIITGDRGTATAGDRGTATAGNGGTATAGEYGTATAGEYGTATAGYRGTATAGNGGTATAGNGGTIELVWFDGNRYRKTVGYIGEGNILADVPYILDAKGSLVRKP